MQLMNSPQLPSYITYNSIQFSVTPPYDKVGTLFLVIVLKDYHPTNPLTTKYVTVVQIYLNPVIPNNIPHIDAGNLTNN
jgi:hypothetical protein